MVENLDKHEAILEDLRIEGEAINLLIKAYETYLATKRGTTGNKQTDLFPAHTENGHTALGSNRPPTLYEGSEKILRAAGKPLHAKIIVQRLAGMGKTTTVNSLAGSLGQDSKGRFERVEPGTFGLTEWSKKHDGT